MRRSPGAVEIDENNAEGIHVGNVEEGGLSA